MAVSQFFDASDVTSRLDSLRHYLREEREMAADMTLKAMRESFDSQRDPETGRPWAPPAASTIAAKGSSLPQLVMTGRLRASLNKGAPGNIFRVGRTAIMTGTSDRAAPFAQYGTRAHEIKAKPGGVLAWKPGRFAKRVSHPGTPARGIVGVSRVTARMIEREMKTGSDDALRNPR